MLLQFIFIFAITLLLLAILVLFIIKAGLQLQYLRIKKNEAPGSVSDFIQFDYSDAMERIQRWQAFLLFPLMYPIDLDDEEDPRILSIKKQIKRIHISIYIILIVLIIIGVYSEKVFPVNV